MKTAFGIAAVATTLSASLITGGIFLSPTAPTDLNADPLPGHITVVVADDEGDAMEGLTVYAADAAGTIVDETKVEANGHADMDLPRGGTYALYTTKVPTGFNEHTDGDGGAGGLCAQLGKSSVRCVTVKVAGSVVSLPGSVDQLRSTTITYEDQTPSPRIRVIVRDYNTGKLVTGGSITITHPTDPTFPRRSANTTGTTVTKEITGRTHYEVSFTPPSTHQLIPSSPAQRSVYINDRLVAIEFVVIPKPKAAEPGISIDEPGGAHRTGVDEFEADEFEADEFEADEYGPDEYEIDPGNADGGHDEPSDPTPQPEPMDPAPSDEPAAAPSEEPTAPAPGEEPAPDSEDTAADDPSLDELRADCFMYLEMYPELVELDPGLPAYCETNPADARVIISGLLTELGN